MPIFKCWKTTAAEEYVPGCESFKIIHAFPQPTESACREYICVLGALGRDPLYMRIGAARIFLSTYAVVSMLCTLEGTRALIV